MRRKRFVCAMLAMMTAAAIAAEKGGPDDIDPRNWASPGRVATESHYSPLDEINRGTVSRLKLAFTLDLQAHTALSTPLAIDGVIYIAAGYSLVTAVDARTGKVLWQHDPEVAKVAGQKLRAGAGIRGLAASKGRLFVGTHDGRLLALDAKKGTLIWGVDTLRNNDGTFISGAPRVSGDKVIIGFGDSGVARGGVVAHAVADGKFLWRWDTDGGGGAIWNAIAADPESGRLYLGTGNERGDVPNKTACSVIALSSNGQFLWQYDESAGDRKTCESSTDLTMATLIHDGQPRRVILHAPRDGSFHVIDRETGVGLSKKLLGEGVHNHFAQSFSPTTGLVYLPTTVLPAALNADTLADAGKSFLLAWDPAKQRANWAIPTPGPYSGGVLSTAGDLVFQGQMDGYLVAYAAGTGSKAWAFYAAAPPLAAPISFGIGNQQYIAVLTGPPHGMPANLGAMSARFGWDSRVHPRRLLVFTLDGKGVLPATPSPKLSQPVDVPEFTIDEALAKQGATIYGQCQWCHGAGAIAGGAAPDLRASAIPMNPANFAALVRGGVEARGMPRYPEISERDLDALRHFFRARARAGGGAPNP
jgi:quinohemoprotein ethanol dehydrogenase